jgi:glycosyltransferase involved in cell wall biosynthesis
LEYLPKGAAAQIMEPISSSWNAPGLSLPRPEEKPIAAGGSWGAIMHILITADTVGGVWSYTQELVTGLAKRGIQVTLLSFGGIPSAARSAWLEGLPGVAYFPTGFLLEWMKGADRDLDDSTRYLRNVIQEVQPDLLHLSQFCYGALDVALPKIVVAHSDVMSWNKAVHGAQPAGRWAEWYYGVVAEGLAGANLLVAPSRWMLDSIESCYGAQMNSRVIYNGRTPERFDPLQPKQDYAASAGRLWDEGKQSSLLMELGLPPLPIRIAGAASLASESAPVTQTPEPPCGVPGSEPAADANSDVRCIGELSEGGMRELLSRAAIYIATSKYEPFGLAPLEAALSRCALVANDIPSLREVWGYTALYFRRDDASSLAEALELLQGNPELRMAYADSAYERARRRYTAGRMVNEYVQAYSALLERRVRVA